MLQRVKEQVMIKDKDKEKVMVKDKHREQVTLEYKDSKMKIEFGGHKVKCFNNSFLKQSLNNNRREPLVESFVYRIFSMGRLFRGQTRP